MVRNNLSEHKTFAEKERAYNAACLNGGKAVLAYYSDGRATPLGNVNASDVEFIGGLWRVQNRFPYRVQRVRDRDFVLLERLPRQEKNHFEFYSATPVTWGAFGAFITRDKHTNFVVAKYVTAKGVYWSYGRTIEQARAFLGIRLYDEYQDLIHSVACENCNVRNVK